MKTHFHSADSYRHLFSPGLIHLALFVLCIGWVSVGSAFDKLTKAQLLVYDTAHLSNTDSGQTITYDYKGKSAEGDLIADQVTLSISNAQENDKRDVAVDFLSDERNLPLPNFEGYRGNPVIIAMLEYISRTMGSESGGGALYFRNRIRDALAEKSLEIQDKKIKISGAAKSVKELRFLPFKNDTYLSDQPHYTESVFTISLSEDVPGGVVSVTVESLLQDKVQFFHGIKISEI